MTMRTVVAAALSVLTFSPVWRACSCLMSNACPTLGDKSARVFVGTVLRVADVPPTAPLESLSRRKARIRVDEPFGPVRVCTESAVGRSSAVVHRHRKAPVTY